MNAKLFVGNLSFQINDMELKGLFEEYGEVASAKVIVDKRTGRSKGFGFVEMSSEDQAKQAMEALNGADVRGRAINVNFARSQEEGSVSGGSGDFRKKRDYNDNW